MHTVCLGYKVSQGAAIRKKKSKKNFIGEMMVIVRQLGNTAVLFQNDLILERQSPCTVTTANLNHKENFEPSLSFPNTVSMSSFSYQLPRFDDLPVPTRMFLVVLFSLHPQERLSYLCLIVQCPVDSTTSFFVLNSTSFFCLKAFIKQNDVITSNQHGLRNIYIWIIPKCISLIQTSLSNSKR